MNYLQTESRARLRQNLIQAFDLSELRALCVDLGLDWENIGGETKNDKALNLVLELEKAERIPELLAKCKTQRPNLDWSVDWTDVKPKELEPQYKLTRKLTYGLIGLAAASAVGIGLVVTRVFAPEPAGPKRMGTTGSTFNLAVAEFAKADEKGKLQTSDTGQQLSAQVYRALTNERERYKQINPDAVIDIWHDSLPKTQKGTQIGFIGKTLSDQELAVVDATRAISADLMIYGIIDSNGVLPSFYVPPTFRGSSEFIGRYRLGDLPIAAAQVAGEDLTARTNAVFWMGRGLDYDGQGDQAKALETFREAEKKLNKWSGKAQGEEILQFFIGQSALYLAQKSETRTDEAYSRTVEAEQAFLKSLKIAPGYLRSQIGLGSVYLVRAQWELREGALKTPELIEQVRRHYGDAALVSSNSDDPIWSVGVLNMALGGEQFLLGRLARRENRLTDAETAFEKAIQTFAQGRAVLENEKAYRLLAQLYQNIGAAYGEKAVAQKSQTKTEGARASYAGAIEAFDLCISQGKNEPGDKILSGLIVATCERQRTLSQQKSNELK